MSSPITSLHSLRQLPSPGAIEPKADSPTGELNFQQLLVDSLSQVNQLEQQAQNNIEARLLGENITSSEVYTSLRKADLAIKMLMQVRNKLVSSYQEIQQMRM